MSKSMVFRLPSLGSIALSFHAVENAAVKIAVRVPTRSGQVFIGSEYIWIFRERFLYPLLNVIKLIESGKGIECNNKNISKKSEYENVYMSYDGLSIDFLIPYEALDGDVSIRIHNGDRRFLPFLSHIKSNNLMRVLNEIEDGIEKILIENAGLGLQAERPDNSIKESVPEEEISEINSQLDQIFNALHNTIREDPNKLKTPKELYNSWFEEIALPAMEDYVSDLQNNEVARFRMGTAGRSESVIIVTLNGRKESFQGHFMVCPIFDSSSRSHQVGITIVGTGIAIPFEKIVLYNSEVRVEAYPLKSLMQALPKDVYRKCLAAAMTTAFQKVLDRIV